MIQELTNLVVADNTGAKRAMCFRILKQRKEYAHLGDVIRVAIKEASPTGSIRARRSTSTRTPACWSIRSSTPSGPACSGRCPASCARRTT